MCERLAQNSRRPRNNRKPRIVVVGQWQPEHPAISFRAIAVPPAAFIGVAHQVQHWIDQNREGRVFLLCEIGRQLDQTLVLYDEAFQYRFVDLRAMAGFEYLLRPNRLIDQISDISEARLEDAYPVVGMSKNVISSCASRRAPRSSRSPSLTLHIQKMHSVFEYLFGCESRFSSDPSRSRNSVFTRRQD